MKISYPLLCYYPSQGGGPANTIYWLNKSMGAKGNKSIIISTTYGLEDRNIDYELLFNNFNINVEFVTSDLLPFLNVKRIKKIVSSNVIHFSSLFFFPTVFLIVIGVFYKRKMLVSPRGELYDSALSRKKIFKSIYLKAIKLFQTKVHFHATNDYEATLIKRYFPRAKTITVLPNYIEVPIKRQTIKKSQILFLGRINPIKNIDLLIKAFSRLPDTIKKEFKLLIAGEAKLSYEIVYLGELRGLVMKLNLSNNVEFLGGKFGEEKEVLLSESYCTVLPSKSENFGNVVLESLCQATPVIVTRSAPWQSVEEFNAGFWIDPNETAITDALLKILKLDESEYKTFQNNALSLALNQFDIEKNIEKWENLYEKLK